jgi:hypothetical protein
MKKELRGLRPRANCTDRRLSAKLMPIFEDRGCHVVSVTDPYGRILGFLDRRLDDRPVNNLCGVHTDKSLLSRKTMCMKTIVFCEVNNWPGISQALSKNQLQASVYYDCHYFSFLVDVISKWILNIFLLSFSRDTLFVRVCMNSSRLL